MKKYLLYGRVNATDSSCSTLWERDAETTTDLLPKPLPSPDDWSVHTNVPRCLVHSYLVAPSSPRSHPGPDHDVEPVPLKSYVRLPLGCGPAT